MKKKSKIVIVSIVVIFIVTIICMYKYVKFAKHYTMLDNEVDIADYRNCYIRVLCRNTQSTGGFFVLGIEVEKGKFASAYGYIEPLNYTSLDKVDEAILCTNENIFIFEGMIKAHEPYKSTDIDYMIELASWDIVYPIQSGITRGSIGKRVLFPFDYVH